MIQRNQRINISNFLSLCQQQDEIGQFFMLIQRDPPKSTELDINEVIRRYTNRDYVTPQRLRFKRPGQLDGPEVLRMSCQSVGILQSNKFLK